MVKPSPILCARLRLTTKQVNGGFYRGSRTGSMGAHTEYGGYVIDWRKTRHFNVPDLTNFKLTPFITKEMEPTERTQSDPYGNTYTPEKVDAMEFLRQWKQQNPAEYDQVLAYQIQESKRQQSEFQQSEPRKPKPQKPKFQKARARKTTVQGREFQQRQTLVDTTENNK